jgi:hypothetical protein
MSQYGWKNVLSQSDYRSLHQYEHFSVSRYSTVINQLHTAPTPSYLLPPSYNYKYWNVLQKKQNFMVVSLLKHWCMSNVPNGTVDRMIEMTVCRLWTGMNPADIPGIPSCHICFGRPCSVSIMDYPNFPSNRSSRKIAWGSGSRVALITEICLQQFNNGHRMMFQTARMTSGRGIYFTKTFYDFSWFTYTKLKKNLFPFNP